MRLRPRLFMVGAAALLTFTTPFLPASQAHGDSQPRGSLTVGTASYPVPTTALYVSTSGGKDTNDGSLAAPLKTVAAALTKATDGTTIVLRAGIYHESVATTKQVVIQNYPLEAVWFDGSVPLTNWTQSGTTWVYKGWTKEFSSLMGKDATFKSRFVDSVNPMAANPDQVLINGVQLAQVGSAAEVTTGKFYMDYTADTITIGSNPTGTDTRASDLGQAIRLSGANSAIRGIGIRNYANGYELGGAIYLSGSGSSVENVSIQDVATQGIGISSPNKYINHVTVRRAGILGLSGPQIDNSIVENSIFDDNDYQDFKPEPEAGGVKITSARGITVRNNELNANHRGSGVWFDVSSYNITLVNNTANDNGKYGLEAEISDTGIIANNYAVHNTHAGITLYNAGNFKVFNNEVDGSDLFGINLSEDQRRQADGLYPEGRDPRRRSYADMSVPWLNNNNVISNNVYGNGGYNADGTKHTSYFQLYALAKRGNRPVDQWNLTIEGNLFNIRINKIKTDPTMVAWGEADNVTLERYETPQALAAAKNPNWVNAQITSSKTLAQMQQDKITYQSAAIPLPADVAAAIGLPAAAGTKHLGNY